MRTITHFRTVVLHTLLVVFLACTQAGAITSSDAARALQDAFIDIADSVQPAVVNINTKTEAHPEEQGDGGRSFEFQMPFDDEFFDDDFFDRFFRDMPDPNRESLGSGFIIDPSGYIMTNAHVVEGADVITVTLSDQSEYEAELVGLDKHTDLAVVKIETDKNLSALTFADSEDVKVGQWVIAVGNPFGLSHSVTTGIISARGRFIGQGDYDDFLQTDAAINPGNSGGPLLDLDGRVVGVNTAIYSNNGSNIGVGFAIPSNLAKSIYDHLREHGKWVRGWLGVTIQELDEKFVEQFNLKSMDGVLVADVLDDTPAAEAGMQFGDVIIEFDGRPVKNVKELMRVVAFTPVNKKVDMVIIRNGREKTVQITVAERPEDQELRTERPKKPQNDILGLMVDNIDQKYQERLELDSTDGVVVLSVKPGSPAAEAELMKGDVILEMHREPVRNVDDYEKTLEKAAPGDDILLRIIRGGHSMFVIVTVKEDAQE